MGETTRGKNAPEGVLAVGEGDVELCEGAAVWRKFEEDLDALLLDDGDVENDAEIVRLKGEGLQSVLSSVLRGEKRGEERTA